MQLLIANKSLRKLISLPKFRIKKACRPGLQFTNAFSRTFENYEFLPHWCTLWKEAA